MHNLSGIALLMMATLSYPKGFAQQPIYKNDAFAVYADSIIQGKFVAHATSSTAIESNYQSPENSYQSPTLIFKFSINRKDNEMPAGLNHSFKCLANSKVCSTPLITFGKQYIDTTKIAEDKQLSPDTRLTIRLDMREVLHAFKQPGYYTTFSGEKIFAKDFKGLFVAGSTAPMVWDFDNLHQRPELEMKDPDGDGIYETTMLLNKTRSENDLASKWKLSRDLSALPHYQSPHPIADAIYNLSLEEMENAVEPDSTFRTGKEWAGVWTRDISYSIILSMAYLQPKVSKNSLLRKVKNGKIIQDTGTGGAYPNSTDRMIWAVAAWELYKATGDRDWLEQSYRIIKNSMDDDIPNAHDRVTGMVRGESSFLDWREQTYPKWMQPVDIFESECLGTNAVHYQAATVLSKMAQIMNKPAEARKYASVAKRIRHGINKHLWMPGSGFYGQYIYGRTDEILSPRAEALGEALTVLFDIAPTERQDSIIRQTPVTDFGITCIYPQIPGLPPYHNNAIWPFVQSYWALAAAKASNETSVMESIAAIYRPAALFVTNKENFVADNGDYKSTVINSSNMLWSLAGNISLVHKILFGIQHDVDRLSFHPFVPSALGGSRSLTNFRYRDAIIDIVLEGSGNRILSFQIDGKTQTEAFYPASMTGKHSIKIILANNSIGGQTNKRKNIYSPATPHLSRKANILSWTKAEDVQIYIVLRNGIEIARVKDASYPIKATASKLARSYQVIAVDKDSVLSFASNPVDIQQEVILEMENISRKSSRNASGFSGKGFIEISKRTNRQLSIPLQINETGFYFIDFRYANGNGPTNTENKCAIRTLRIDRNFSGTVIFPQRGVDEWSNWGYSNPVKMYLTAGKHFANLNFEPPNENMNGEVNQAMLDYLRLRRIE